jgi:hypothetical protein
VRFRGQAKARNQERPPYNIPVLLPKEKVLQAWQLLRDRNPSWSTFENRRLTNAINGDANKLTRELFGGQAKTFKDLRSMYAAICYEKFGRAGPMAETKYCSTILGHAEKNNSVGVHYTGHKVTSGHKVSQVTTQPSS